ncbi:MAG TPA: MtrAB system histidine kinase MtrB [Mycobacteriales bacterium]|nr:MtrAB system histidine kinase MtrB [Mycobacteriales bacterium]
MLGNGALTSDTGAALRRRVGDTADRARHGLRAALRLARRRWRRSLQLRVATTTLVASGVVVLVVGGALINQVAAGVLDAKVKAATQEASGGVTYAREQFRSIDDTDADAMRFTVSTTTRWLALQGGSEGSNVGLFDVVFQSSSQPTLNQVSDPHIDTDSIPKDLQALVEKGNLAYAYGKIRRQDGSANDGLIVGGPVPTSRGDTLGLYYLFHIDSEARTIKLVQRIAYSSGIAVMLLVVAIAVIVTSQVVRPVRLAAQTASRFAQGHLEERMKVTGEDDLSLLAARFNGMADSLQRQITRLEELSRLQQRFTSDVSHELRTPLTTVRMAADVLHSAREEFTPGVARSAELLQAELDRFEVLLADLLEISRYDAGAAVLEAEPVDLRALIDRVIAATAAIVTRHGSEVVLRAPAGPVLAEVDPRRVERILRNLVGNAVEHGEGLPVEITLASDEHAVAVAVRDHGVGLQPGEAAMVFNRFWRADPSRNRRTGGTGLGLSISLEDARLHGGWLHAWGRPGSGSQFRLTVPRCQGGTLVRSPLSLAPASVSGFGAGSDVGSGTGSAAGSGAGSAAEAAAGQRERLVEST